MNVANMNLVINTPLTSQPPKIVSLGNQISFEEVLMQTGNYAEDPKRSFTSKVLLSNMDGEKFLMKSIVRNLEQYVDNKNSINNSDSKILSTDWTGRTIDGSKRKDEKLLQDKGWEFLNNRYLKESATNQKVDEMITHLNTLLSSTDDEADLQKVLQVIGLLKQWTGLESKLKQSNTDLENPINSKEQQTSMTFPLSSQEKTIVENNVTIVDSKSMVNSIMPKQTDNPDTLQEDKHNLKSLLSSLNNEFDLSKVPLQFVNLLKEWNEYKNDLENQNNLEPIVENEYSVRTIMQKETNNQSIIAEVKLKFESLLDSLNNKSEIPEVLPQLLNLIAQWSELETEDIQFELEQPHTLSSAEQNVWTDILNAVKASEYLTTKSNELNHYKFNDIPVENIINSTMFSLETTKSHLNASDIELSSQHRTVFNEIISKSERLLSQVYNKDDISKVSPKVLELLKQFSDLQNKGLSPSLYQASGILTKEQKIWSDILQSFQRRDNLLMKQQYQMNSEVTTRDLTKWLEKAFEKYGLNEKQPVNLFSSGTPLSRMEQYVIHINPNNEAKLVNQELLKQFQSIIKSSKFLTKPNGMNQMSIVLRPDQLGEMRIRLLQINGEMTVRMVVSSQAAKEMLETNMNQLRHMFSPHQVTVEKQELSMQQESINHKDGKEEQLKENNEEQSNPSQKDGKHSSEEKPELDFSELLMNLKI